MSKKTVEFLYQNEQKLSDVQNRLTANTRLGSLDLLEVLISHLQLQAGLTLLDVGCGTGQHLEKIAQHHNLTLYGIDPSIENKKVNHITLYHGNAENLPFENDTFHRLMCNYAIYYVDQWQQAISEMLRVCQPQSRIVISGPAKDNNQEFYQLHRSLFGEISAIDQQGLNFISDQLEPYLSQKNITFSSDVYENKITYQKASDFVGYYTSTSLFRMTSQNQNPEDMKRKIQETIHPIYNAGQVFENTKKIKVLTLTKN